MFLITADYAILSQRSLIVNCLISSPAKTESDLSGPCFRYAEFGNAVLEPDRCRFGGKSGVDLRAP